MISVGGTDNIDCDSSNSPTIVCNISPEQLVNDFEDFHVFYKNPCDNGFVDSGILLRRQYTEIYANNIVVTETNTQCTFSPITQVSFSFTSPPQGELTLRADIYTNSTSCSFNTDTSIMTCDISLQDEGYYYMKDILSTYFFERIYLPERYLFYVRITTETDDFSQSQLEEQTIDEDTMYFIVNLSGEENEIPKNLR